MTNHLQGPSTNANTTGIAEQKASIHSCGLWIDASTDRTAHGTIEGSKTVPSEAATSRRDLAKSPPISAKTREVSMATTHNIRNHSIPESAAALPPGRWVASGGIKRFVADIPPVQFADACHCGDYFEPGESCLTCIAWAEKDARLHAEAQTSWANRHRVWEILELRKQVAA